jgi:hypothetical protein
MYADEKTALTGFDGKQERAKLILNPAGKNSPVNVNLARGNSVTGQAGWDSKRLIYQPGHESLVMMPRATLTEVYVLSWVGRTSFQ